MSLGRLLTAGRSLVGGQNGATPYKMNKHLRLPKFGSPQNPFVTEAQAETPSSEPVMAQPDPLASTAKTTVQAAAATSPKRAARSARVGNVIRGLGEQWSKVNPLSRQVKPAIPRFDAQVVQGELSLEKVKVIRNDLSEADLEIVRTAAPIAAEEPGRIGFPALAGGTLRGPTRSPLLRTQPAEAATPNASLATAGKAGPAGNAWRRLTARFFGARTP